MLGAEERRLRRMNFTSQGGATEGNKADGALMADQGLTKALYSLLAPIMDVP